MLRPSNRGNGLARNSFLITMIGNPFVDELGVLGGNWLDMPCKKGAPNVHNTPFSSPPAMKKREAPSSNLDLVPKRARN